MDSKVLLPLMLLLPLIGAAGILTLPRGRDSAVRIMALFWSLATFAVALIVAVQFDWSDAAGRLQFVNNLTWVESFGMHFGFGIDAISLWLILLTVFLMPLTILGSFSAVHERAKEFFFWLLILEAAMLGVFVATDLVFFYICFEFTLIPLYFLIGIFGSNQRLAAARVFFLYTFTGSMLTFAGVLYVAWFNANLDPTLWSSVLPNAGHWTFNIQDLYGAARQMSDTKQMWVLLALLAGFAVKVPLFPLHTWLPLAHTEAPTAGSVILAGVLLKLGTYGLLRFAIPMTPHAAVQAAPYIACFAIAGILYTAVICWVQRDLKKLIAYSSVSHLGFCVLGMFALNAIGVSGSIIYMINHGLSTGALFLCVGMIYERFHTREMAQMSGLARAMPVWAFFMVFFTLASVGLPGLNGFVGEFLALLGTFTSDGVLGPSYAIAAAFGMIFAAIYLLYMVGKVVWGPLKIPSSPDHRPPATDYHSPPDLNFREIITLVPLAAACLWLGLYPAFFLRSLQPSIDNLTEPARIAMIQSISDEPDAPETPESPGAGTDVRIITREVVESPLHQTAPSKTKPADTATPEDSE